MNPGTWHQFADRSQKLAIEQLEHNVGEGVIISPRDLAEHNAAKYSPVYQEHGAQVLFDTQFYKPDSKVGKLGAYDQMNAYRATATELHALPDDGMEGLTAELVRLNQSIGTSAVLAPSVIYEAGQPHLHELNTRLNLAAAAAADELGLPLYATVALGRSATSSDTTIEAALSHASGLDADGWYFAYQFDAERVPSSGPDVYRCLRAGLRLALTSLPVLHAYAGPLGLLSPAFGATGIAVGHSQTAWRFNPDRWEEPTPGGGGGDAPARLWSEALWGTIIHPDETVKLPPALREEVVTDSPYLDGWSRWEANKHLVHVVGTVIQGIRDNGVGLQVIGDIQEVLVTATDNHELIAESGTILKDDAAAYQESWLEALLRFTADCDDDLQLLADLV